MANPVETSAPVVWPDGTCARDALASRPARPIPLEAQNDAFREIAQALARPGTNVLQQLVEHAMRLCGSHSAGVSLIEFDGPHKVFRWYAVAGRWSAHLMGSMPRDASPCGIVVDRRTAQLMPKPELYFPAMLAADPPATEALLVPFHAMGETVGTVWIVAHGEGLRFCADDLRVMESLACFAAAAYVTKVTLQKTLSDHDEAMRTIDRLQREIEKLRLDSKQSWRFEPSEAGAQPR